MFLTQLFFRRSVFLKTKSQKAEITFLKVVHPDKLERFGLKNSSIVDNVKKCGSIEIKKRLEENNYKD